MQDRCQEVDAVKILRKKKTQTTECWKSVKKLKEPKKKTDRIV